MRKLWGRYSWLFNIIGFLILSSVTTGAWLSTVSAYDGRITKLEGSVPRLEKNLAYLMGRFKLDYDWRSE